MGRKRAIVVAGPEGLDEAGSNGTGIAFLKMVKHFVNFTPEDLGMERIAIEDIRGEMLMRMRPFLLAFSITNQVHS